MVAGVQRLTPRSGLVSGRRYVRRRWRRMCEEWDARCWISSMSIPCERVMGWERHRVGRLSTLGYCEKWFAGVWCHGCAVGLDWVSEGARPRQTLSWSSLDICGLQVVMCETFELTCDLSRELLCRQCKERSTIDTR